MMLYPKIQTLYKRNMKTHKIMPGVLSKLEFGNICKWQFTEKIDGMNIRVEYDNANVCYGSSLLFGGRTGKSILSEKMLLYLRKKFTHDALEEVFSPEAHNITLFGEGYGGGIQKGGGGYREDNRFILFSVYIDGWWVERQSIEHIAHDLGIKCVPIIPGTTIEDGIAYILAEPQSMITENTKTSEGVVATSDPLILFRNRNPLMWKLKCRDYQELGLL